MSFRVLWRRPRLLLNKKKTKCYDLKWTWLRPNKKLKDGCKKKRRNSKTLAKILSLVNSQTKWYLALFEKSPSLQLVERKSFSEYMDKKS